jgi:ribosomal protein L37AE/L43A
MSGETSSEADPESTAAHYDKETKALEAQDNLHQTKDRIANPPSVVEARVKHEEDLTQRAKDADQRARDAEEKLRTASDEARKDAENAAVAARQEADTAKDELHTNQLTILTAKIDELAGSRKPMQQQMDEYFSFAGKMAEQMGWVKPGTVDPAAENPTIALEIVKINIEDAHRQREHESQLAKDKRDWELQIAKMNNENAFRERELAAQAKKDETIANALPVLGRAIAQGLVESAQGGGGGGGGGGGEGDVSQQSKKMYRIEIEEGKSGKTPCPHCKAEIEIDSTATIAKCSGCNTQFPVIRYAAVPETGTTQKVGEHEPDPANYEEDH